MEKPPDRRKDEKQDHDLEIEIDKKDRESFENFVKEGREPTKEEKDKDG